MFQTDRGTERRIDDALADDKSVDIVADAVPSPNEVGLLASLTELASIKNQNVHERQS